MQKLMLLCGLPGCGKSTIAKKTQKKNSENTVIISRDNIRTMVSNTYTNYKWTKENEMLVNRMAFGCLEIAIETGLNVIIDETNLTKKRRRKWIVSAKLIAEKYNNDLIVSCVWVNTSPEECKKRREANNKGADTTDWSVIIDGMVESWEDPTEDEFDKLFIVKGDKK